MACWSFCGSFALFVPAALCQPANCGFRSLKQPQAHWLRSGTLSSLTLSARADVPLLQVLLDLLRVMYIT